MLKNNIEMDIKMRCIEKDCREYRNITVICK